MWVRCTGTQSGSDEPTVAQVQVAVSLGQCRSVTLGSYNQDDIDIIRNNAIEDAQNTHHRFTYDRVLRYCVPCASFKLPRSHHCSTCRRCVAGYDHHCIITGHCIGRNNIRQFALYLLAQTVALLVVAVQLCRAAAMSGSPILDLTAWLILLSALVLGLPASVITLGRVVVDAAKAQTRVEVWERHWAHTDAAKRGLAFSWPYDRGSVLANLASFVVTDPSESLHEVPLATGFHNVAVVASSAGGGAVEGLRVRVDKLAGKLGVARIARPRRPTVAWHHVTVQRTLVANDLGARSAVMPTFGEEKDRRHKAQAAPSGSQAASGPSTHFVVSDAQATHTLTSFSFPSTHLGLAYIHELQKTWPHDRQCTFSPMARRPNALLHCTQVRLPPRGTNPVRPSLARAIASRFVASSALPYNAKSQVTIDRIIIRRMNRRSGTNGTTKSEV
eukprot:CAMPEP_0170732416 /NCGR_PEP_ID=MMETSP0437-20130122/1544_1 /TAXON_ID=0 /ORGANISM="Sexangularia sp." /LENGTH=444 /DNA_ID=CAMNT_0011070659 /DNA_START=228 /DNA_END=1558 /DNA_ORIENTATION=-